MNGQTTSKHNAPVGDSGIKYLLKVNYVHDVMNKKMIDYVCDMGVQYLRQQTLVVLSNVSGCDLSIHSASLSLQQSYALAGIYGLVLVLPINSAPVSRV